MSCNVNVMSMWSLRWHFTNKSVTGHLTVLKVTVTVCHTAGHYGEEYDDWNMQCRLKVAAELQQWWRGTNRRRNSVPRSSSSDRESSITQRGASCGRYDQRRRRSTLCVCWSRLAAKPIEMPFGCRLVRPKEPSRYNMGPEMKFLGPRQSLERLKTFAPTKSADS